MPRIQHAAAPVVALTTAVFLSGCFDDSAIGPAQADPTLSLSANPRNVRHYEVTIENLTPATGMGSSQPFSPAILATHDASVRVFEAGVTASPELELVAEDAINDPLIDALTQSSHVADVTVGDGVILPGGSETFTIDAERGATRLSAVFMLVNTNDGFSGAAGLKLPQEGEVVQMVHAWDAGTELNTEAASDIPGPCCGSPGAGPDSHGYVTPHQGISGSGDLDPAVWGWDGPVARITVRRIDW